jgi:glycosyltransferase involved in cell wall biosynthesis
MALRLHVLYEHGPDGRPYSTSHIRILRPLGHPALAGDVAVTSGLDYFGERVDAVVVDRLWRPDVSPRLAEDLIRRVRRGGARLVHFADDDFFALAEENTDFVPLVRHLGAFRALLAEADGVVTTTDALAERLRPLSRAVHVVPNALDERLVHGTPALPIRSPFDGRLVVGYMGTFSHDADLRMVAAALEGANRRVPGGIAFEVVGAVRERATLASLSTVPVRRLRHRHVETEYPAFLPWFCARPQWDVGIAPLRDRPFNRTKSDIKFLDYAAAGIPGIFSRGPAYDGSVVHGRTGWLVDNDPAAWEEALVTLLADPALRLDIAVRARRYLEADRVLARRAPDWLAALRAILADDPRAEAA